MRRSGRRSSPVLRISLASLLAGSVAGLAAAQAPPPPVAAPGAASAAPSSTGRDAELGRRLDALLDATEPGMSWTISVEAVVEKGGRVRKVFLWSDGVGIWDDESQFRLEPAARKVVLKAFRDNAFCETNDELFKEGSGKRKSPNGMIQEQSIVLEIGGVSKTVNHIVSTFGTFADVEEAAKPLVKIVNVVRATCEKPAAGGIRAKDLADGLTKVARGQLADVALKVAVNRPTEADGNGWMARVEGKRVTARVSTKEKGWAPPAELRLSNDDFLELVRALSAANPGAFPQNLYDEGYTDLTVSVLNRSVNAQARPFSGMDPKAHEKLRAAYRAVVASVRKLHEKALLEGKRP